MIDLTIAQFSIRYPAIAKSACGPVALAGAMRALGGEACERHILAIAREEGWWTELEPNSGMLGPAAFEAMARMWGVILESIDPERVAGWARAGWAGVVSTEKHYYLAQPDVTGYVKWPSDPDSIYVGNTGLSRLAIAAEWTTVDRIRDVDGGINGCWRCVRLELGGPEVTMALDLAWLQSVILAKRSKRRAVNLQEHLVTLKTALGRQA